MAVVKIVSDSDFDFISKNYESPTVVENLTIIEVGNKEVSR